MATYDDVPDCDSAGSALTYDTTANNIDCATGFALLAGPTFSGIVTLPFALDPTTDANAEVSFDSDGWGSGFDAMEIWNGVTSAYVVATTATSPPSDGQVPKWNTGGAITWQDDAGAAGGDSVTIDGEDTTDPDFTSVGDLDVILCAGDGDPDASCGKPDEVIFRVYDDSHDHLITNIDSFTLAELNTQVSDATLVDNAITASSSDTLTNKAFDGDGIGNALMIPDGATGVASATENIAIDDSNEGQLSIYDGGSSAARYINVEEPVCRTLEDAVAADDDVPWGHFRRPLKILSYGCCDTDGSATATVALEDHAGNLINTFVSCSACSAVMTFTDVSADADGTLAAGEGLRIDIGTGVASGSWVEVCYTERALAQ